MRTVSPRVSAVLLADPKYPEGADGFSPSEDFPELPFRHRSVHPNPVYRAVRQCLADAGLDAARFGTPAWNPLSEFVGPAGRVFVLANFVFNRLPDETREAFQGKCTHAAVLRPVIDYALKAVGPAGRVEFGNAPLQSCRWQQVLRETESDRLLKFYQAHAPGQVAASDLRGQVVVRSRLGYQRPPELRAGEVLNLDLGTQSLLEAQDHNHLYRVAQYDPRQTMAYHRKGSHVYALHARIAAADLVISVPKLKTHEKVGMTGALKGCVGATALKQCLAHHRKGPPAAGGDEHPDGRPASQYLSALSDWTWTRPEGMLANLGRIAEKLAGATLKRAGGVVHGAWPGNDTCWRMALDIARCVVHAAPEGGLREDFCRPHLVLTDGVIGGEGLGPLKPSPVRTGWIAFASDPFAADYVNCLAMGFDPARIPLVREALHLQTFPLSALTPSQLRLWLDGREVNPTELRARMSRTYRPPPSWIGAVEG